VGSLEWLSHDLPEEEFVGCWSAGIIVWVEGF